MGYNCESTVTTCPLSSAETIFSRTVIYGTLRECVYVILKVYNIEQLLYYFTDPLRFTL